MQANHFAFQAKKTELQQKLQENTENRFYATRALFACEQELAKIDKLIVKVHQEGTEDYNYFVLSRKTIFWLVVSQKRDKVIQLNRQEFYLLKQLHSLDNK